MIGAIKDYLSVIQSVAVIVAISVTGYTFLFAPVDAGIYRVEKGKSGWAYMGNANETRLTNQIFVFTELGNFKVKAKTKMKASSDVSLREAPRTPIQEFIRSHSKWLGVIKKDSIVCVRDTARTGFSRLWLYVEVLPDQSMKC